MKTMVNIALPKGRLGEKVYGLLKNAGFSCQELEESSRKLVFENQEKGVRYFWVKPSDVAIYVERGAADIGIVGKDILLEYEPEVYELLDLKMGRTGSAVGFAIYLNLLEQIRRRTDFDVDAVLLYEETASVQQVLSAAAELRKQCDLLTATEVPKNLRWRKLYQFREGEVILLENNG